MLAIGQRWKTAKEKSWLGNKALVDPEEEAKKKRSGIGKRYMERKSKASDASKALLTAGNESIENPKTFTKNDVSIKGTQKESDLYKRLEELDIELKIIRAQLMSSNMGETNGEILTVAESDPEYSAVSFKNGLEDVKLGAEQAVSDDIISDTEKKGEGVGKEGEEDVENPLPVYTNMQMMYICYRRLDSLTTEDMIIYAKENFLLLSQLQSSDIITVFNNVKVSMINISDETDKIFDVGLQYIYNDLYQSYESFKSFENDLEMTICGEINELYSLLMKQLGYFDVEDLISMNLGPCDSIPLNEKKVLLEISSDFECNEQNVPPSLPPSHQLQMTILENSSKVVIDNDEKEITVDKNIIDAKKSKNYFWWIK